MKLPNNFNKQDSLFFVPEELREHFENVKEPTRREINDLIRDAARQKSRQHSLVFETVHDYNQQLEQLEQSLDLDEVLHSYAMTQAAGLHKKAEEQRARMHKAQADSTCPVCGTITLGDLRNPVKTRSLNLEKVYALNRETDFRSCFDCYLAALELRTQQALAATFGRKTRLELVQKALT